jgi:hypothetical protein
VENRQKISFVYNQRVRIVEPQCYGIGTRGTELLRGRQVQGGQAEEPLFDVAKMSGLVVLDQHFAEPGPHYRKNDAAMVTIFAQL